MRNTGMIFASVIFSLILVTSVIPSYSEYLSPKKQLESGVLSENIQCMENKVLVMRDNGKVACVSEKTAEKKGWDVIATEFTPIPDTKNELSIPDTKNELSIPTTWKEAGEIQKKIFADPNLKKIPNLEGDWTPILDKESFAKKFAAAAGDKFTHIDDKSHQYLTEKGSMTITDVAILGIFPDADVMYFINEGKHDQQEQIAFINNFMSSVGYKLGDGYTMHESWIEDCQEAIIPPQCEPDGTLVYHIYDRDGDTYSLAQPHSLIRFVFTSSEYVYGWPGISIYLSGWTNHPELVKYTIEKETAIQIARDYVLSDELFLNVPSKDGGICEYELWDDSRHKVWEWSVFAGVPYYVIRNGICTYDVTDTGHVMFPLVAVDGYTGESIFITQVPSLD